MTEPEAKALAIQATQAFTLFQRTGLGGETASHQLLQMIRCNLYPLDLCAEVEELMTHKYPEWGQNQPMVVVEY